MVPGHRTLFSLTPSSPGRTKYLGLWGHLQTWHIYIYNQYFFLKNVGEVPVPNQSLGGAYVPDFGCYNVLSILSIAAFFTAVSQLLPRAALG